jgi:RNA polymerase sigma-54 factor
MALQLEEQGKLDAPMQKLLDNLDLLGAYEFKKLQEICEVNETYFQDMVAELKTLNPRPAGDFDHFVTQTVVPDVLMKKIPKHLGGGWRVELNAETLPRVLVNNEYYTTVLSRANTPQDKTYLNNQLTAANWLAKALDSRAQTILKTASMIVEEQDAFFLYGVEFLKPMTLKDIADKIEMHESTVSRVTSNKYIGTPRGLFELKYFFTTGLMGADGLNHSAESIKSRIKALIDAEDPKKILSDDTIVDLLQQEGIEVARRTVAKYREALHIPSSVQRRKMKKHLT